MADEFQAFFSYAHADAKLDPALFEAFSEQLGARVTAKLANAKLKVWRDIHKIETGDRWDDEIKAALKASQFLIVMLSPNWLDSDYCRMEFESFAASEPAPKTFVIPLIVHGVEDQKEFLEKAPRETLAALMSRQFKQALADDFLEKSQQQMSALVAEVATHIKGKIDALRREKAALSIGASTTNVSTAPDTHDISRIENYAPEKLIGRDEEIKTIDDAWAAARRGETQRARVLSFVALGGEGKTSLVAKWAVRQALAGWKDCDAAFAWSFYSQGSRDQYAGDSDLFLAEAVKFFGLPTIEGEGGVEKAKRLAKHISEKRALLILDGLEPLQYPPTWQPPGELKDDAMATLLKRLAASSKGLCLVTTRYSIPDLKAYREVAAPEVELKRLSNEAGAHLLQTLGVKGTQKEREELSNDAEGHALTLMLIGAYLRDAHGGDIRKRDLFNLAEANEEEERGKAFRAIASYEKWLETNEQGGRALAMLRLMGLFDRPAYIGDLRVLWRTPAIQGLTEAIVDLGAAQRSIAIQRLEDAGLLTVDRDARGALVSLDAHPLIREFFASEVQAKNPDGWRAAHLRLYERLMELNRDGAGSSPFAGPSPIENLPSPFTFGWGSSGKITIVSGPQNQPVLPYAGNEADHKAWLETCRQSIDRLLSDLRNRRINVRSEYIDSLERYGADLPREPGQGNFVLADQEARILREMFAADADCLAAPFAARLKGFLQHHIALRAFYPELDRLYSAIRNGQIAEPLPLDNVDRFGQTVAENTPEKFEPEVSTGLIKVEREIPAVELPADDVRHDLNSIKPPPDPVADFDPKQSRSFNIASAINSLWKVVRSGKAANESLDGWSGVAEKLGEDAGPVIEWLNNNFPQG